MRQNVLHLGLGFFGYTALNAAHFSASSAVSDEAQSVRDRARCVMRHEESSEALFGTKKALLSDLWSMHAECAEPDWDGNGAEPLNGVAVAAAAEFIRALPPSVPMPEVAPDPDGAVSFDWSQSRLRKFTLSISSTGRLAYAWMDGTDRGHGVAKFDGSQIPDRVVQGIQSIMSHGNTGIRTCLSM